MLWEMGFKIITIWIIIRIGQKYQILAQWWYQMTYHFFFIAFTWENNTYSMWVRFLGYFGLYNHNIGNYSCTCQKILCKYFYKSVITYMHIKSTIVCLFVTLMFHGWWWSEFSFHFETSILSVPNTQIYSCAFSSVLYLYLIPSLLSSDTLL